MKRMERNIIEATGNTVIGLIGFTFTLGSANAMVGILVGLLTASYLSVKIYFLIKNKGK
ncbi:MAG TPA: hypothetical protein VHO03_05870 [Ignavibacteriales bacterium]|nr:hypothetical protein [Ignavibacteriales bacterium]